MEHIFHNLWNIINFLIFLGILVFVHEWGHFITAKKLGVNVEKFALGFGPTLFSRKFNGTEYMLNLIPLGGYVKMVGDVREECKGKSDEFFSQPIWVRSWVVFNGPLINFVLAWICLVAVYTVGYPDLSNKVGELIDGYPAAVAGLQKGDRVVEVDGVSVGNWTELQANIAQSTGDSIRLSVFRNDERIEVSIIPQVEDVKNIFGQHRKVRLVGIRPDEEIVPFKYDFVTSLKKGTEKFFDIIIMTYKALYYLVTGSMSVKDSIQGPVGIFNIVTEMSQRGLAYYLLILGIISANLAIFNLLPMMPLDGGHLFLFCLEKLRGKALPTSVDEGFSKIGFGLLILLLLFTVYNDLVNAGFFDKLKQFFS